MVDNSYHISNIWNNRVIFPCFDGRIFTISKDFYFHNLKVLVMIYLLAIISRLLKGQSAGLLAVVG